jgi:PAS domain-containing protein
VLKLEKSTITCWSTNPVSDFFHNTEAHVQVLRDTNQVIPQPVAMLLADARRKEDKRTAKRVANRKSACTSRARKKALVEEMTRTNARLKRQAMILALLPDLVIAITIDGQITFCSAQVSKGLGVRLMSVRRERSSIARV